MVFKIVIFFISSNYYGSIKKRLTTNQKYDGEAAVFKQTVVYSSHDSEKNDYNLFRMDLADPKPASKDNRVSSRDACVVFSAFQTQF